MSKLYDNYKVLKCKDSTKIYLFKSGIFYIALDDDATKLSSIFNFKITNLNDNVVKCGFPIKRLNHYINLLNSQNIKFEIIDSQYGNIENYSDYLNNNKIKEIINNIKSIDFDDISYKQAYEILYNINNSLKDF